jgi:hypothetical protein
VPRLRGSGRPIALRQHYAATLESWRWIGATDAEIWMTTGDARLWPQIVQNERYARGQRLLNAIIRTGAAYNLGTAEYDCASPVRGCPQ